MLTKHLSLLLVTVSLSGNEGAVVVDCKDPELAVLEERCKGVLQQASKAHCSNGPWAEQVEELKRLKDDLMIKSRTLKRVKKLKEHIHVEMVMAGLNAFDNVDKIESLTNGQIATDTWQLMMEIVMYSLQLDYLTALAASDLEEESTRIALVKHVVQQASNLLVAPTGVSEGAKEVISSYIAQMQEMVTRFDPTLNLPSLSSLLARGTSKSTAQPVAVGDEERPKVLRMDREAFAALDREEKVELTKGLSAGEWNELLENFWVEDDDNARILYYTLKYNEERRLEMIEEALASNLECLFIGMCDLAYVPRTLKVIQLLERGLKVYPHLRDWILHTLYQLEYPTTEWHLGNTTEDVGLLKDLIVKGWIKREAMAGHWAEIATSYPLEVLDFLIQKKIPAAEDLCTMKLYHIACGLGWIGYLEWSKDNCELRPDQGCIDAAVSGGHGNVVEFVAKELGRTMVPSQEAMNEAAANGMLTLLRNKCHGWGLFPNTGGANEAAKNRHLDVLKWLRKQGVEPDQNGANLAAENGHLDILKWLATLEIYSNQCGATAAAKNGYLDVLKWVKEQGVDSNQDGANLAAHNGHLDVLKWLKRQGVNPNHSGANAAAKNGHLDVLRWLKDQGVDSNHDGANAAAEHGHIDVLKWLTNQGTTANQNGADAAASNGHLGVLKWLNKQGIDPNQDGANRAAENRHLDVLEWLATLEIYPNQRGATAVAKKGHLDVLKWLKKQGVDPNQDSANHAAHNGHLGVLKWLRKQAANPDQNGANAAAKNGHVEVLKWLAEQEIYPGQDGADWATGRGHLGVLKWLATLEPEERRVYPSRDGANWAARNGHPEVLEWLRGRGLMSYWGNSGAPS